MGVMPKAFTFSPDALSLWVLITPGSVIGRDPDNARVGIFGMLRPGVTRGQAQRELETLYRNEHQHDKPGESLK